MFNITPGKKLTYKTYSVSYLKAGTGGLSESKEFARLDKALEFYQVKKAARVRYLELQVLTSTSLVEVLDAKKLLKEQV
jgi:hypothetical protein